MLKAKVTIMTITLSLVLFSATLFAKGNSETGITGMYSDMCYNDEGDDLLGMEVFLVYADSMDADSYYVCFQNSEGAAEAPTVIKATVNEKKMTVDFVFPKDSSLAGMKFHGVIKKDGMRVNIKGAGGAGVENEWLKKQPSYWEHRDRDCKKN